MGLDGLTYRVSVTTTHSGYDWQSPLPAGLEDKLITPPQSIDRQLQFTELITLVGVDSSLVKDHFRTKAIQNLRKMSLKYRQILFITNSVWQVEVECTLLLACRKILLTVHREGEDVWIAVEDRGGTVSLMNITIDDCDAPDQSIALQDTNRDGNVVEHAVPFAMVRICVMGPPSEIRGNPIKKGAPRGEDRPLYSRTRATDKRLRPGEPDPAYLLTRQLTADTT